jgi:hypothetical protein
MMTIRPEQERAVREHVFSCFKADMHRHLRTRFHGETRDMADGELADLVSEGCSRARQHRITNREDVRRFLECMVVHGRAFPEDREWARKIIMRHDLSGTRRMDQIADYEVFSLRTAK